MTATLLSLLAFLFPLVGLIFVVAAMSMLVGTLRALIESDPLRERTGVDEVFPLPDLPQGLLHRPDA